MSEASFRPHKYRIAMEQDFDSGGWVEGVYVEAIEHAMIVKAKSIKNAVNTYSPWWLVLVDHIRMLRNNEEASIFAGLSKPKCFARVIILDHKGNKRFEI